MIPFLAAAVLLCMGTCNAFTFSTQKPLSTTRRTCKSHPYPSTALHSSEPSSDIINESIWDILPPKRIEGNSLQTWSFPSGTTRRIQVSLQCLGGRPIEASVELWQSPSYTPTKFTVECEDGSENIVHSIIELPVGRAVTLAVYNTEGQEFPLEASVMDASHVPSASTSFTGLVPQYIEGNGAVKSYNFPENVESVEVLLRTTTRNMKAYIEILHGPNDDNEIVEVETDNANVHPFYTIIQTPGGCNTLRIVNEDTLEFPLEVFVRPFDYEVGEEGKPEFNYGGPYF